MQFFYSIELESRVRARINSYSERSLNDHVIRCHWHDCCEVLFCKSGRFTIRLNFMETEVSAGDMIIIEPGIIHESVCTEAPGEFYVVQYEPSFVNGDAGECSTLMRSFLNKRYISSDLTKYVLYGAEKYRGIFDGLTIEYERKEPSWMYMMRSLMLRLYGELIRSGLYNPAEDKLYSEALDPSIKKACSYIEQNYHRHITLDEAARTVGYSRTYLSRLFSRTLNTSFSDYLSFVRMYEAEQLLWKGVNDIDEIAAGVGYESVPAFYRAFRRVTGVTPGCFLRNDFDQ